MNIRILRTKDDMGSLAAGDGAALIRKAIEARGEAGIVVATGASQFEMLAGLVQAEGVNWNAVTAFHLDEYVGLPITHSASFRLYLWRRFVSKLPLPLRAFHYLNGEADAEAEAERVSRIIRGRLIDVMFIGIGENGHIAFNDPPADFDADRPYLVVELDEACRRQQLGEGWFPTLADVPTRAISMSVRQIMTGAAIICTVPDERKAEAVRNAVEGDVTPDVPASILQRHEHCTLYLDEPAASRLSEGTRARAEG